MGSDLQHTDPVRKEIAEGLRSAPRTTSIEFDHGNHHVQTETDQCTPRRPPAGCLDISARSVRPTADRPPPVVRVNASNLKMKGAPTPRPPQNARSRKAKP